MKIKDAICFAGSTGSFCDDQVAVKNGAKKDGFIFIGDPVTPKFKAIRVPGESISIVIVLEDGQIAQGDCCGVYYSGVCGRDPLFIADEHIPTVKEHIIPWLIGQELASFRELARSLENLVCPDMNTAYHTAIRYGVSQALLDAVAKSKKKLMAEIIADEYGTEISKTRISIFSQTEDRYDNADRMILRNVDVLPNAMINNLETKVGKDGKILEEYVAWLSNRVSKISPNKNYFPILHIDCYGTIAEMKSYDKEEIIKYLIQLGEIAKPYRLRIEEVSDMGSVEGQVNFLKNIKDGIKDSNVEIVVDEWCNVLEDIKLYCDKQAVNMINIKAPDLGSISNTIEAILYCKKHGVGAYLGGTANGTVASGQVCAHVAMATCADQVLARPGLGVDEGYMITYNEMMKILALTGINR